MKCPHFLSTVFRVSNQASHPGARQSYLDRAYLSEAIPPSCPGAMKEQLTALIISFPFLAHSLKGVNSISISRTESRNLSFIALFLTPSQNYQTTTSETRSRPLRSSVILLIIVWWTHSSMTNHLGKASDLALSDWSLPNHGCQDTPTCLQSRLMTQFRTRLIQTLNALSLSF